MKPWALVALILLPASWVLAEQTPPETTIKGGRMELLEKGNAVVFRDGVTLTRGGDVLKASQMRTSGERDKVKASGNVRLVRTVSATETWKAWGETGYYETKTGGGYLEGRRHAAHVMRVEVLSSTATRVMNLYADRIDFSKNGKSATALGGVRGDAVDPLTADRYEFHSDRADYDADQGTVTLTGSKRPWLKQWSGGDRRTVRGDVIVYDVRNRRLTSEGHAEAVMEDAQKPGKAAAKPHAGTRSKKERK